MGLLGLLLCLLLRDAPVDRLQLLLVLVEAVSWSWGSWGCWHRFDLFLRLGYWLLYLGDWCLRLACFLFRLLFGCILDFSGRMNWFWGFRLGLSGSWFGLLSFSVLAALLGELWVFQTPEEFVIISWLEVPYSLGLFLPQLCSLGFTVFFLLIFTWLWSSFSRLFHLLGLLWLLSILLLCLSFFALLLCKYLGGVCLCLLFLELLLFLL
jgi:hypothetical protein